MKRGEKGEYRWVHARRLYRDWGSMKVCFTVFSLIPVGAFVFFTIVCGFADGFSLKMLAMWGKVWGLVLLIIWALLLPAYYLWAWAQGGLDEWEYEMDRRGIKGRKIVHKAWRMKVLRALAWITMFFPAKPGQRMAMRQLLYDSEKKEKQVDLIMLKDFACDEKRGKIAISTLSGAEEIHVPREDYAEVVAFIGERLQKKRPKRKPAGDRKRKPKTVSEATTEEKEDAS